MKLPSGREISIDSLVDAAEMLAEESFHLDCMSNAEEEICDWLRDECFSLSGTEKPFGNDDVEVIIHAIRPAAERLSGELYELVENRRPLTTLVIEKGVTNA